MCAHILKPNLFRQYNINTWYLWPQQLSICIEVLRSIHFSIPTYSWAHGHGDLQEPLPAVTGQGKVHPKQVCSLPLATWNQTTIHSHLHTNEQFRFSNRPHMHVSELLEEAGEPGEKPADTEKICKLHTEKSQSNNWSQDLFSWEAAAWTTAPQCCSETCLCV